MNTKQFFEENATKPTAWSAFVVPGELIRFSMAKEIYKRDEKEIKALVSKYNLKVSHQSGSVTFYKD